MTLALHFFKIYLFILERAGQREIGQEGEGQRERKRDSTLRVEPDTVLHLTTLRSGPELKLRVRCLTD